MENNFSDFFAETKTLVKSYTEKRLELVKLQATLKSAKALGLFFSIFMVFFLLLFAIVFLGMSFSFWIADKTGSFATGFGISAAILLFIFIIVLVLRKKLIQTPVANMVVREIGNDEDEI